MIKRCKLCGGEPKWVHYAIPEQGYPEGWDFFDDDDEPRPMVLFKRLECKDCKATTAQLFMMLDDAEQMWNEGHIVQYQMDENAYDVEPKTKKPTS